MKRVPEFQTFAGHDCLSSCVLTVLRPLVSQSLTWRHGPSLSLPRALSLSLTDERALRNERVSQGGPSTRLRGRVQSDDQQGDRKSGLIVNCCCFDLLLMLLFWQNGLFLL